MERGQHPRWRYWPLLPQKGPRARSKGANRDYRRWRGQYGADWEAAFRNRFEKEMIDKFDTHFFVGTVHQHPGSWIIVGLFYPPRGSEPLPDLFA
jgi:hypothetical protein